jgi:hypothetical protein
MSRTPTGDALKAVLELARQWAGGIGTELFEERAAIMEHDGGMSRAAAENAAAEDVQRRLMR